MANLGKTHWWGTRAVSSLYPLSGAPPNSSYPETCDLHLFMGLIHPALPCRNVVMRTRRWTRLPQGRHRQPHFPSLKPRREPRRLLRGWPPRAGLPYGVVVVASSQERRLLPAACKAPPRHSIPAAALTNSGPAPPGLGGGWPAPHRRGPRGRGGGSQAAPPLQLRPRLLLPPSPPSLG